MFQFYHKIISKSTSEYGTHFVKAAKTLFYKALWAKKSWNCQTRGTYTKETQEYTYVYEIEKGMGTDIPPKTGVVAPESNSYSYINYILLLLAGLFIRKRM